MRRPGLVLAAAVLLALPPAAAARDARLVGAFAMSGTITAASHVRGERTGQHVQRRWRFTSRCAQGPCRTVTLRRVRAAARTDTITLKRTGAGRYRGLGRFTIPLLCHGHTYARGGLVSYRVSVTVRRTRRVQTTDFATRIAAVYRDTSRVNRTPCPGGLGHDAARYTGVASAVPAPPVAAFTATRTGVAPSILAFRDTSRPGSAPLVSRVWNFGDPASGAANTSVLAAPMHTFAATGPHAVKLLVRDANGLVGVDALTVTG